MLEQIYNLEDYNFATNNNARDKDFEVRSKENKKVVPIREQEVAPMQESTKYNTNLGDE